MYEIWKLYFENYKSSCQNPKCWQSSVVTLTLDLLTPKCIGIVASPSCIYLWNMTAVRWKVNVSEPKCWQSSVVTLTFDLLTPKCIGIVPSPYCIYVWNMKDVRWKLLSYRVRTKVLKKFHCDLDLWPLDPKMYRYLPVAILHLCMKCESCMLKTTQVIVSEPMCWRTDRRTDGQTWFQSGARLVGPARLVAGPNFMVISITLFKSDIA